MGLEGHQLQLALPLTQGLTCNAVAVLSKQLLGPLQCLHRWRGHNPLQRLIQLQFKPNYSIRLPAPTWSQFHHPFTPLVPL